MIKLSQNDQHMFKKSRTPLLRRKSATTCTKFGRSTKTVATCFAYIIGRKLSTKPTKAERASTVASGLRPLRQASCPASYLHEFCIPLQEQTL